MNEKKPHRTSVIPGMTYRDAPAAIEWLCKVFGFEKHAVYPGPDDTIMHSELTLGDGMIMLGSAANNAGGAETRSVNLIVPDADAIYAQAKAAGAEITREIAEKPYGGRGFSCRDPEGHQWNVDTYDPWALKRLPA